MQHAPKSLVAPAVAIVATLEAMTTGAATVPALAKRYVLEHQTFPTLMHATQLELLV